MDRRMFFARVAVAIIAAPRAAEANQDLKSRRIGILSPHKAPTGPVSGALVARLAQLGWKIEYVSRHADARLERLPSLAAELVRLKVDLLVTDGTFATKAAKEATVTIPVVFAGVSFPVEAGIVASLARPGGNVTGATDQSGDLQAKLLQLIIDTVPKRPRIGFLSAGVMQHIDEMAQRHGLTMVQIDVQKPEDLEAAFATCSRERVGGLIVPLTPVLLAERDRVAKLALQHKVPTFTMGRGMAEAGLLMSYHPDWQDVLVQAANQVDRILRGAKPADLPVVQPTRFELLINMRTATSLGLTVPSSVLLRADELIR